MLKKLYAFRQNLAIDNMHAHTGAKMSKHVTSREQCPVMKRNKFYGERRISSVVRRVQMNAAEKAEALVPGNTSCERKTTISSHFFLASTRTVGRLR